MLLESMVVAVVMGLLVIFIRLKAAKKPVNAKKIILPPLFMSTGALMFLFPFFRVSSLEIIEAMILGLFFSIFLIKTSTFEVRDNDIYLKRSKAFGFIIIGLLLIRLVLKMILSSNTDVGELSGMFWLIAFFMIVPWRIAMYIQYRKIAETMNKEPIEPNSI